MFSEKSIDFGDIGGFISYGLIGRVLRSNLLAITPLYQDWRLRIWLLNVRDG